MAHAVLHFNEQLEHIGEVGVVMTIGAMLSWELLMPEALWFLPLLFLFIRPVSVELALLGSSLSGTERFVGWFGIRGVGSLYYLLYTINNGLPEHLAPRLVAITLTVVTISIFMHGISVTPLMGTLQKARRKHTRTLAIAP